LNLDKIVVGALRGARATLEACSNAVKTEQAGEVEDGRYPVREK
jgi:hypothetical protein